MSGRRRGFFFEAIMRSNLAIAGSCHTITDAVVLRYSPALLWGICYWGASGTGSCSASRAGLSRFCPCRTDASQMENLANTSSAQAEVVDSAPDSRMAVPNVTRWATVLEGSFVTTTARAADFVADQNARDALEVALASMLPNIHASVVEVTAAAITSGRRLQSGEVTVAFRVVVPESGVSAGDVAIALAVITPSQLTMQITSALGAVGLQQYAVEVSSISEPIARSDLVAIWTAEVTTDAPNAGIAESVDAAAMTTDAPFLASSLVSANVALSGDSVGLSIEATVLLVVLALCCGGCCGTYLCAMLFRKTSRSETRVLTIDAVVQPQKKIKMMKAVAPHSVVPSSPSPVVGPTKCIVQVMSGSEFAAQQHMAAPQSFTGSTDAPDERVSTPDAVCQAPTRAKPPTRPQTAESAADSLA